MVNSTTSNKKQCLVCQKIKPYTHFFKSNDYDNLPDGRYHTCSQCVKEMIDENDMPRVHALLAEVNRPFLNEQWKSAIKTRGNTISNYMKLMANANLANKTYSDSDVKMTAPVTNNQEIKTVHGYDKLEYLVTLTDEIRQKWIRKSKDYTELEMLQLEIFCINMKYDYDIETTTQETMLEELSVLNLEKQKLLNSRNFSDYKKVSDVYKSIMQDAGFRPIDKKNADQKTGVDSLGEMIAHLERDGGFIPPNRINYPPDDIDRMLTYYIQWAQRFTNQSVTTDTIKNWRDDVNDEDIVIGVVNSNDANQDEDDSEGDTKDTKNIDHVERDVVNDK